MAFMLERLEVYQNAVDHTEETAELIMRIVIPANTGIHVVIPAQAGIHSDRDHPPSRAHAGGSPARSGQVCGVLARALARDGSGVVALRQDSGEVAPNDRLVHLDQGIAGRELGGVESSSRRPSTR